MILAASSWSWSSLSALAIEQLSQTTQEYPRSGLMKVIYIFSKKFRDTLNLILRRMAICLDALTTTLFICLDHLQSALRVNKGNNKITELSQQPENCENRNDPDLVQAFLTENNKLK